MEAERRRFSRRPLQEAVRFEFKDPGQFGGCLSADISQSGIRIHINDYIPQDTSLSLRVQISPEQVVDCTGRVVWVEKERFSDRYQAGLQFDREAEIFGMK